MLIVLFVWAPSNGTVINQEAKNYKSDISFVIHTFDGYKRYWSGMLHFLKKYYIHQNSIVYFANEDLDIDLPPFFQQIKCGKGTWGFRLKTALEQIPTKYVVYLQEDMWLTHYIHQNYFDQIGNYMEVNDLYSVKLFGNCQHNIHCGEDLNNPLWYIGTHQPSMWNREFLLSTVDETMSPFKHEVNLNKRLHKNTKEAEKVLCGIPTIGQVVKYEDVSRRGQIREVGKKMLEKEGLKFEKSDDEVYYRGCEESY
jgi:hypothetical protein